MGGTVSALTQLVHALQTLPGVGSKSAYRMAFHLLQHDRPAARHLARALMEAADRVGHCALCQGFCEDPVCAVCLDPERANGQLCVVETPADQEALERTGMYRGRYYVLMGRLSPLEGRGPSELGMERLLARVAAPAPDQVTEVVLATNFTAEGEVTAHVLGQLLRPRGIRVTRLAQGIPVGSELEYVDLMSLGKALIDRRPSRTSA